MISMTMKRIVPALAMVAVLATAFPAVAADEGTATDAQEEAPQNTSSLFQTMQRDVEAMRILSRKEAESSLNALAEDKNALLAAVAQLRAEKQELQAEAELLQQTFEEQQAILAWLEGEAESQKASSKNLEGAVHLTAQIIRDRASKSTYASLHPELFDPVVRIIASAEYPSHEDVQALTNILFMELSESSRISITPGTISLGDGKEVAAQVLRVGTLLAAAKTDGGEYVVLMPTEGGKKLTAVPGGFSAAQEARIKQSFEKKTAYPADFSGGTLFAMYSQKKTLIQHVLAGGVLVWPILTLGAVAFLFGLWRLLALYRIGFGADAVLQRFFSLVHEGGYGQAEQLLQETNRRDIPVYAMLQHMLAHWKGGTISNLEKCRDEAILVYLNPLERGVTFVALIAALAPLLGLLGTVTGMISTFDVITIFGNSDPKLLSGGISVALVTTELGLVTAIPLLFLHFLLTRRIDAIADDMDAKGAVLIARAVLPTSKMMEESRGCA